MNDKEYVSSAGGGPKEQNTRYGTKYYLTGLGFLALVISITGIVTLVYMMLHGLNIFEMLQQPTKTWAFGYIGGSANPASIGAEIMAWSLIGVSCQIAYLSGKAIIGRQFQFWDYSVRWISASFLSWGIAVAVIFTLIVVTLDIGGIEITLANASIETIIAISFILGFYNDESRALLDRLRERMAIGLKGDKQKVEGE